METVDSLDKREVMVPIVDVLRMIEAHIQGHEAGRAMVDPVLTPITAGKVDAMLWALNDLYFDISRMYGS